MTTLKSAYDKSYYLNNSTKHSILNYFNTKIIIIINKLKILLVQGFLFFIFKKKLPPKSKSISLKDFSGPIPNLIRCIARHFWCCFIIRKALLH